MQSLRCAMGYPISNRNSSQAHVKLLVRVAIIFPNSLGLLECALFPVHVFPASLPSPARYTSDYDITNSTKNGAFAISKMIKMKLLKCACF